MASIGKPLPRIDEESRGWFEGLARHELWLERCGSCGTIRFYPRAVCTVCLSSEIVWERASGRGTVYTFTVTYQNQSAGFRDALPYNDTGKLLRRQLKAEMAKGLAKA